MERKSLKVLNLRSVVLVVVVLVLVVLLVAACSGPAGQGYVQPTPNATTEALLAPGLAPGVQARLEVFGKVHGSQVVRIVDDYSACYYWRRAEEPVCVPIGGR